VITLLLDGCVKFPTQQTPQSAPKNTHHHHHHDKEDIGNHQPPGMYLIPGWYSLLLITHTGTISPIHYAHTIK